MTRPASGKPESSSRARSSACPRRDAVPAYRRSAALVTRSTEEALLPDHRPVGDERSERNAGSREEADSNRPGRSESELPLLEKECRVLEQKPKQPAHRVLWRAFYFGRPPIRDPGICDEIGKRRALPLFNGSGKRKIVRWSSSRRACAQPPEPRPNLRVGEQRHFREHEPAQDPVAHPGGRR